MDKIMTTKEKIFHSALDLFLKTGYYETSVRQLADAVGIRVSSLYNHYPGKEAILEDILMYFETHAQELMMHENQIERLVSTMSPEVILTRGFERIVQSVTPSVMEKIYFLIVIEVFRNNKVRHFYERYMNQNEHIVTLLFAQMQRKKLIKTTVDPEILADSYIALISYYHHQLFLSKADHKDLQERQERMTEKISEFVRLFIC